MHPLDDSTLQTCLLHLPDWEPLDGVLSRQFQFANFYRGIWLHDPGRSGRRAHAALSRLAAP